MIIKPKKGYSAWNFNTDSLAEKWVEIIYKKRSRLGKILKTVKKKRISLPKGVRLISINNHKPKVGYVTINYKKK